MKNDLAVELGERLRGTREKANLSQKDLAAISSLSRITFSNYENGNQLPPLVTVIALSVALGCCPAWLAFGKKPIWTVPPYKHAYYSLKRVFMRGAKAVEEGEAVIQEVEDAEGS